VCSVGLDREIQFERSRGSGLCGLAKAMWAPGLPTRDMDYARKMPNRVLIDIF
jgi:hypothetical protein